MNATLAARTKPSPLNAFLLPHEFFKDFDCNLIYKNIRPGKKVGDPQVIRVIRKFYIQFTSIKCIILF
jgi:hypothetical protein